MFFDHVWTLQNPLKIPPQTDFHIDVNGFFSEMVAENHLDVKSEVPRLQKIIAKAPNIILETRKVSPRIPKKTSNHPTHPFNTPSRILWPGGMREAIK